MPGLLRCPSCDTQLKLRDELAPGADVRCPKCGTEFQVPAEVGVQSPASPGPSEAAPPETPPSRRGDEIAGDRDYASKFSDRDSGRDDDERGRDGDRRWDGAEGREYEDDRDWRRK